jgi:hypothetical protein
MRRNEAFWGAVLLIAGTLFLLDNLNILERLGLPDVNLWGLLWPLFLIALGVSFLLGRTAGRGVTRENASIPLEGAREAEISLRHGAGRLSIRTGTAGADLLSGTFTGGLEHSSRLDGQRLAVQMRVPGGIGSIFSWPWNWGASGGIGWDVNLNPEIPLDLALNTGAGETLLDLRDLQVRAISLETGASATELTLPAAAGLTQVRIKSGVSSVKVRVPDGVAARIRTTGGLSSTEVDTLRFPQRGGFYESLDFETAENRAEIDVEMGVGSVEIR